MPEEVKNSSQLESVNQCSDVILQDDIYITEDFTSLNKFSGMLDGNNYTIYNLNQCLIEELSETATIENITFENVTFSDEGYLRYVHYGIFRKNKGTLRNITVKNSTVDCTDLLASDSHIGILTGENKGEILSCNVYASIHTNCTVGLFCSESENGKLQNCEGSGEISGYTAGGIVGKSEECTVEDCDIFDLNIYSQNVSGGIIGLNIGSTVQNCTIKNSEFKKSKIVGSVIGSATRSIDLTNCFVTNVSISGIDTAGGLIGQNRRSILIENCHITSSSVTANLNTTNVGIFIANTPNSIFSNKQNCSAQDCTLLGDTIEIELDSNFENCYIDLNSKSNNFTINFENTERNYYNTSHTIPDSKTVKISSFEDFEEIQLNDTVELLDDVKVPNNFVILDFFNGTFNGNGNSIQNLKSPLFISNTGTVQDLTIQNFTPELTLGNFFGAISHVNTGKIENVTVNICIEEKSFQSIGCISGYSKQDAMFEDCEVTGEVRSQEIVGGITAMSEDTIIKNCHVNLKVNAEAETGGIVGRFDGVTKIKNCKTNGVYDGGTTGGIVGTCPKYTKSRMRLSNCKSKATISGDFALGGIIGNASMIDIIECEYSGKIKSNNKYVGGITGRMMDVKIERSVNTGKIEGNNYTGGICGSSSKSLIQNCTNKGDVDGSKCVGGLTGESNKHIKKSSNHGNITGKKNVGGLVGEISNTGLTSVQSLISNCYNNSKIFSKRSPVDPICSCIRDEDNLEVENVFWIPQKENQRDYQNSIGTKNNSSVQELHATINI